MQRLAELYLLFVFLFSIAVAASAEEPDQEAPKQANREAQKSDTKASAGDLAKAVQNPMASSIGIPAS
jgi:hypothetical protein